MENKKIEVFVRTYPACAYCDNLKTLLDSKGIIYSKKDIVDEDNYEEFASHRLRTVPAVFIDGVFFGGFTEMNDLLKEEK